MVKNRASRIKATRIKSSTAILFGFGLLFGLASLLVVFMVGDVMRKQALAEAESKARILLDQNLAIHSYYSNTLKPSLFEYTAPFRNASYFDPSWMSSTYAVRQIRQYFNALNPSGYYAKDAAVNARSPENEADEVEKAFLGELRADPGLILRSYTEMLDGVPSMVYLRRGEVLEESCMGCHSELDRAPAELVSRYGSERSFHREAEVGKVISVISIRIPLAASYSVAERFSFQLSILLLVLLASLFLVQYLLTQRLLYRPIASIRDKARQICGDEERLGELISLPFGRELGEMAEAFNLMSVALRKERDELETRIKARTEELAERTDQMQKSLKENQGLLSELQHRAKNSFNMISSMIGMAVSNATSSETRKVVEYLGVRVKSVSELYDLLYSKGSVTEVRLDDYCTRIAGPMIALNGNITLEMELESLTLSVKEAAPIGLILTELVTNVVKYAFPGGKSGTVTIGLKRTADGKALLEVSDDGIGLPAGFDLSADAGMGLNLIQGLAGQIGGVFRMDKGVVGTRGTLEFGIDKK